MFESRRCCNRESAQSRTIDTRGDWKCIQVTSGRSIATLPGTPPPFPPIEGLDDDARQGTYFTVLHPACQFAVAGIDIAAYEVIVIADDSGLGTAALNVAFRRRRRDLCSFGSS